MHPQGKRREISVAFPPPKPIFGKDSIIMESCPLVIHLFTLLQSDAVRVQTKYSYDAKDCFNSKTRKGYKTIQQSPEHADLEHIFFKKQIKQELLVCCLFHIRCIITQ